MANEQAENTWAIILTSGGKFLVQTGQSKDELVGAIDNGDCIEFDKAAELNIQLVPVPNNKGQLVVNKEVAASPFANTYDVNTPLFLSPIGAQFLQDMSNGDQERYKRLWAAAEKISEVARAADAGVSIASSMPPADRQS